MGGRLCINKKKSTKWHFILAARTELCKVKVNIFLRFPTLVVWKYILLCARNICFKIRRETCKCIISIFLRYFRNVHYVCCIKMPLACVFYVSGATLIRTLHAGLYSNLVIYVYYIKLLMQKNSRPKRKVWSVKFYLYTHTNTHAITRKMYFRKKKKNQVVGFREPVNFKRPCLPTRVTQKETSPPSGTTN